MSTKTNPHYDAIVLGSGPNELVCAAYLAKAGRKVLVVERRGALGGVTSFQDIGGNKDAGAFRLPVASPSEGWLSPKIVKDLGLETRGYAAAEPAWSLVSAITLRSSGGEPFVLHRDLAKTRAEIAKHSASDAAKWEAFSSRMHSLAGFLETLYTTEPPRLMSEQVGDLFSLLTTGLRLRRLGKVDMIELLRTLPMSVQDLLDDTFETDVLKAAIGAGGITNILQGPRSAGTCFVMLHHMVGRPIGAFRARSLVTSEQGHLLHALALTLKALGVETRMGADAVTVTVDDGRATGIVLGAGGEEIRARAVLSGADPKTTLLRLVRPSELEPDVVRAASNVKLRGARAVVHLALSGLPSFDGVSREHLEAGGAISFGDHLDYLERAYDDAKHGDVSRAPFLEATIPSLYDPSLAPAGQHVMSIAMQYAPYHLRAGAWDASAKAALAERVLTALEGHAPKLRSLIVGQSVYTPFDLERDFGLAEGHLHGGELTLDQILFMRPIPGFAHYRSPIEGLFMCGDACHPGGALPGLAGANAAREMLKGP